jgi:two-component system, cell cycle response regulator
VKHLSKILIVDDDLIACETLASLLKSDYYEIFISYSGKDALESAEKIRPDIILLDVMMPEIDGFEVCQKIRKNPLINNVPIIMVTALDDRESKLRGIEVGADDYISKPYDRLELRLRIKTITSLNRVKCTHESPQSSNTIDQIMIMVMDPSEKITYCNPLCINKTGYSKEELLGSNFLNYYPFELNQTFHDLFQKLQQEPKEWKGELNCVTKAGELLKEYATIIPLLDASGSVTQFVKISVLN